MARTSQPKVGKLKSSSPGKSQPKTGTLGAHARKVASQPKLGNRTRRSGR